MSFYEMKKRMRQSQREERKRDRVQKRGKDWKL